MLGNLTRDPEYKQLATGQAVCRLGLASNRQFKNRQTGAMVQEVCFVDVDVWGPQAESCNQYLQKGRQVLVEGRLKLDSWEDTDGNKRSKHSIVADRVTFISATGAQAEDEAGDYEALSAAPSKITSGKRESSFMSAMNDDEMVAPKKRSARAEKSTGEIDFKDEKPFADELPF